MSYMLRPEVEEESEAGHQHVHILTHEPISLRRIGIAVSLGSVIILSLAGLPSWSRHEIRPVGDGSSHAAAAARSDELARAFADLAPAIGRPATQQAACPTTAEVDARLQALQGWHDAVLLAADVDDDDLRFAGLSEPALCATLLRERRAAPLPLAASWRLLLLDEQQRVIGCTDFDLPHVDAPHAPIRDADLASAPLRDARLPDWPAVAVFTRNARELPSDG